MSGTDGRVTGTIDRQNLYRTQNPQGFHYGDILRAHRQAASGQAGVELTDDSTVAEYAGLALEMVPGSEDNFKITTEHDLLRAEALFAQGKLG